VVTGIVDGVPVEIARHRKSTPGSPVIVDEHYPESARGPRPEADERRGGGVPGDRPRRVGLAGGGRSRRSPRHRLQEAEAGALAKLRGTAVVDRALGTAALAGRFADADLRSILDHQAFYDGPAAPVRAGEDHSLQPGTGAWSGFGHGRP